MPADIGEIKAVLEEVMEIMELTSPLKINEMPATEFADTNSHRLYSLTCIKMKLSGVDSSGRPKPVPVPGSEFIVQCDTIIPAIGQELDIDFAPIELLKVKSDSYETQIPNVFIGGDAMRGASTAINAIGDGRKAAAEIIKKAGIGFQNGNNIKRPKTDFNQHIINRSRREYPVKPNETSFSDRKNFKLVSTTLSRDEAIAEASRCLLCDEVCNICTTVCPNLAFHSYQVQPVKIPLQKIKYQNGKVQIEDDIIFEVNQEYQILHIADWCNECGNCTTFCPTSGVPYKDKPHLYISRESFDREKDGYFFESENGAQTIHRKKGQFHSVLTKSSNRYKFNIRGSQIALDKHFRIVDYTTSEKDNFEINLKEAAEMKIIMEGAVSFFG